jgi:hypothetical protein
MFVAIQWTTQEQAKIPAFHRIRATLPCRAVRTGWNQAILGDFSNKSGNKAIGSWKVTRSYRRQTVETPVPTVWRR